MGDDLVRRLKTEEARSDPLPTILGETRLQPAPPLDQATVGLVTTAGIYDSGNPGWRDWRHREQAFGVIARSQHALRMGHRSANFDRSGFAADVNVAFPIDRLEELQRAGAIKAVAPRHVSFMGALRGDLATIRMDTGPAAARMLREDGVNVVLLTPV